MTVVLPPHAWIVPTLALGVLACATTSTAATETSPWHGDQRSAVRLVGAASSRVGNVEVLRAGLEIRLQPGWKTYWRYPGDSGVPPRFDFTASDNVQQVSVLWPAPQRFADGAGGHSIGYADRVLLPLHIVPSDPAKPVTIRLSLDYAICEKLCVPVDAKAVLPVSRTRTAHDAALAAAEARVPKRVALGGNGALRVLSVRRDPENPRRVLVDADAPAGAPLDLFVEGPTPDWALPLPEPVAGSPAGVRRFAFALDGLPPGAKAQGAVLTLTAVSRAAAIEVAAPLE